MNQPPLQRQTLANSMLFAAPNLLSQTDIKRHSVRRMSGAAIGTSLTQHDDNQLWPQLQNGQIILWP